MIMGIGAAAVIAIASCAGSIGFVTGKSKTSSSPTEIKVAVEPEISKADPVS